MKTILRLQVAASVYFLSGATDAHAQAIIVGSGTNDFSKISRNILGSIEELPGLLTGIAYLLGLFFGVMGILKLKDHVENPSNTPMKEGAIRLAGGGALFALPLIFEAMKETIGDTSTITHSAPLERAEFNVTQ